MVLQTVLTQRLGLRYPIIAAPLGRGSTPDFLATLAREGAMGFVALGHMPERSVPETLSRYIAATGGTDRFGVNLVLIADQTRRLDAALDAGCRVVSVVRGDPESYIRRARAAGATVFWTVKGPADAARAEELGVDFIVAQGREAGGHLTGEAPLMALVPALVDAAKGVPVIAAGGIADGRGLAAALTLGACGVWIGTRFIASAESGNHAGHKRKVVGAGFSDLVETTLFDGGWPDSPHRVVRNSTYQQWQAVGCPASGSRPRGGREDRRVAGGRSFVAL
jgi:nitronate monooxygenase